MADAFGLIGKVLGGQFRVDELVGEGGFSVVYKGFHMGLKEPVAIKCLRLPQLEKKELADQFAHRFRDESRIAYRLSQGNLNIVRSITSGTTQDARGAVVPYMVLEWLAGETLGADLERRRNQGQRGRAVAEAIALFTPAAEALSYAHSHGVIHRDVKPQNLFLATTREGVRLKVLDFGMAKILSDGTLGVAPLAASVGSTLPVFSPAYAAPEQFDWKVGLIGTWTDVYSFAMVFLEALGDQRVRTGTGLAEQMVQACDPKRKIRPRDLGVPLGPAVDDVLARALSLKPKERQQDMAEFWNQIHQAHKTDSERSQSIPVSLASEPPSEEIATAITDTRSLFTEADLGRAREAQRQLQVKTDPRPFSPHNLMPEVRTYPSDAPTMSLDAVEPVVPGVPAMPRPLDQTLVTPPPVHEAPKPNRTLFGPGPIESTAVTAPRPGITAPSPSGQQRGALNRTLALGSAVAPAPVAITPPAPAAPPAMVAPEPIERAETIPAPALVESVPRMPVDAAAPPVARAPVAAAHDSTAFAGEAAAAYPGEEEVPTKLSGPHAYQPGQAPPMQAPPQGYPQGYAQPYPQAPQGYPAAQQQQQHYAAPQGSFPQTAGYAPTAGPASPYGPPPGSPYGPPPMQAGDGYVNVAPPNAGPKPPLVLFVVLGIAAVLLLSGIGTGVYLMKRSSATAPTSTSTSPRPSAVPVTTVATPPMPTGIDPPKPVESAVPPPSTSTATPTPTPAPEPVKPVADAPPVDPKPDEPPTPPDPVRPRPGVPVAQPTPTPKPIAATSTTPKPAPVAKPSASPAAPVDPDAFNAEAARSSLRAMEGILASCKKPDGPTGPGNVKVTFGNAGNVTSAVINGAPYEGTPVGDCAASRFRMARVSPFQGAPGVVDYAFRISK